MTAAVYVLNNNYECVGFTRLSRALTLIRQNRASVVKEASDKFVNTSTEAIKVPLMIRLFYYVKAFARAIPYSKKMVLDRDDYVCQYCGEKAAGKAATVDHVIPQCQGGRDTWENTVCACKPCNGIKANRTPVQAGMKLLRRPTRPTSSRTLRQINAEARRIMLEEYGISPSA
jgi:5-methylcytosine-specific restriction endonuclease McrA